MNKPKQPEISAEKLQFANIILGGAQLTPAERFVHAVSILTEIGLQLREKDGDFAKRVKHLPKDHADFSQQDIADMVNHLMLANLDLKSGPRSESTTIEA